MQRAVIFDIDGTLADNSERQKILQNDGYNWKLFFEKMGNDKVNSSVLELYNVLKLSQKYKMFLVSGRPEEYRKLTEQWLIWNKIEFDELYMRPNGDYRSDVDIKKDILKTIQQKYKVSFVFDDRNSVVEMWRSEGLTCFQCADHNY